MYITKKENQKAGIHVSIFLIHQSGGSVRVLQAQPGEGPTSRRARAHSLPRDWIAKRKSRGCARGLKGRWLPP